MKKTTLAVILILYTAALIFSFLLTFKSGASIFYHKEFLRPELFQTETGSIFRYKVSLPPALFPLDRILLYEDGHQLTRASASIAIPSSGSVYTTGSPEEGAFYIYISPAGASNPSESGSTYMAYCAFGFLSPTTGIVLSAILLFGLALFARYTYRRTAHLSFRSAADFNLQITGFIQAASSAVGIFASGRRTSWRAYQVVGARLLFLTALAAFSFVFMEWLFQVTKTSFMDGLSTDKKLEVYLLAALALAALSLCLTTFILLTGLLLRLIRSGWLASSVAAAVPTVLFTALVTLSFDHFTYTIFRVGILTASGPLRAIWGIAICLVFLSIYLSVLVRIRKTTSSFDLRFPAQIRALVSGGIMFGSIILVAAAVNSASLAKGSSNLHSDSPRSLPNIILIGSDGVSASRMSVYGYQRETTPRISGLAQESLIAENAFTNAGYSYGSVGSILTGKLPTQNHLLYSPDILQGKDRYEHLPEILKDLGYTTVQFGVPYYVDAYSMNFQDGFDAVNGRSMAEDRFVSTLFGLGYDLPAYLVQSIEINLMDRFSHAFFIQTVENPFLTVTSTVNDEQDIEKIQKVSSLLDETKGPVFAHVHLMGTHGANFDPGIRQFSNREVQTQTWMADFYDDAILTFDGYIGSLVDSLKTSGEYENTMIILYSDHAMQWGFDERIPLIVHFPGGEHAGRIQANVQNLDIAPTILNYLDAPIPAWMEGSSLLQPLNGRRLIFTAASEISGEQLAAVGNSSNENNAMGKKSTPITIVQVVDCQRWYRFSMRKSEWSSGEVTQHTAPCSEGELLDISQIKQAVADFLPR